MKGLKVAQPTSFEVPSPRNLTSSTSTGHERLDPCSAPSSGSPP